MSDNFLQLNPLNFLSLQAPPVIEPKLYMGSLDSNSDLGNHIFTSLNPLDPETFRQQGHMVIDFLADYYHTIEKYPVRSQVEPGYLQKRLPKSAPFHSEPIETILEDVQNDIIPGLTHWQSPNFFAYFQSNGSVANFLGEMLCTGFNVVGFNWMASPVATELESIIMEWLAQMLQLPKSFHFSGGGGGVLHGSSCEAFVCTLMAARVQKLNEIGQDNIGRLVVYCSDQTHFSIQKAVHIIGINPVNIRTIPTTKSTNFQLSPESLRSAILADINGGLIPLYLCTTVGTTASTAVDPLGPLCEVAKEYKIWVHVDAAYAGSACVCPEFRYFLDGVEGANSISLNAHKWFLTSLDCCCLWVKDPSALTNALSTNPELLRNCSTATQGSMQVVDYKDWQIALSRRFRALKLWLVLRSYGVEGIREFIRGHVKMAKHFEGLVAKDNRFEVLFPRNFAMVCFRIITCREEMSVDGVNELNRKLLEAVNASGRVYMTHAVVGGVFVIRFAVGATLTQQRNVNMAWEVVQEHAAGILMRSLNIARTCNNIVGESGVN